MGAARPPVGVAASGAASLALATCAQSPFRHGVYEDGSPSPRHWRDCHS